jgi:hypothetical protein
MASRPAATVCDCLPGRMINMYSVGGLVARLIGAYPLQADPGTAFEQWAHKHGRTYLDQPQVSAWDCHQHHCLMRVAGQHVLAYVRVGCGCPAASDISVACSIRGVQEREQRFRNWMANLEHVVEHSRKPSTMRVRKRMTRRTLDGSALAACCIQC